MKNKLKYLLIAVLISLVTFAGIRRDEKWSNCICDILGSAGVLFYDGYKIVTDATHFTYNTLTGLRITSGAVDSVPLTIKGAPGQTGYLIQAYDNSDNDIFHLFPTGHLSNLDGMNTESAQYGTGFMVHNYGESVPEHTNGVGSYDHTGGTEEALFTKSSGDDFTQADADGGTHIIMFGANTGATAEIKEFIDADNVIVDGCKWVGDLVSQSFFIFKHPSFVTCDGNSIEISVDGDGKFEIFSYNFTGPTAAEIELDAAADEIVGLTTAIEANGYNSVVGHDTQYRSGDLQPGDVGANQIIQIDDAEATSADSSTQIAATVYTTVNASDAAKDAVVVLPGFTSAFKVFGSEAVDPDYGYETTSGASTDRVNSGGAGNDAFVNLAVDVELFDSTGDDIIVSSDSTFEILQIVLSVSSAKDLEFNFWYSKAGGNWTALSIQADNTDGFLKNGSIVWAAPGDWTKDDEDLDGNAITNAYHIALTRTYGPVVSTLPTESFFKIFADQATGMRVDGRGFIEPRLAADADAPNRRMYESTDSGVLVYKDSGGTVNDLY